MLTLDHIAIAAETLEAGRAYVEEALGARVQPGGAHAHYGTHNLLMALEDGLYLEVIAIDPAAPAPGYARWFDLDRFAGPPRIGNWICRTDDLAQVVAALPQAGVPVALARGDLHWHMAVPENGQLPYDGAFPACMQWQSSLTPPDMLRPSGCRLTRLEVAHPQAGRLKETLAAYVTDPRIEFVVGPSRLRAQVQTPAGRHVVI